MREDGKRPASVPTASRHCAPGAVPDRGPDSLQCREGLAGLAGRRLPGCAPRPGGGQMGAFAAIVRGSRRVRRHVGAPPAGAMRGMLAIRPCV